MRRHVLGILAIGFLALGGYFYIWPPLEGHKQFVHGSSMRIGIVLMAMWLAYPEIRQIPRWMYTVLFMAAAIVMIQPKAILVVIPALLVIWLLRKKN